MKYKTKFDPAYCQMLDEHLKDGWSFISFGGVIRVHQSTLWDWIREFPEFRAVKEKHARRKVS